MSHSPMVMVVRVFIPFALGYFLSYLYRVVNAVIAPDLTEDLGLGPDMLGVLTATYFLTFAAFQLPLGVLLDRFGPRIVEATLLVFAAIGGAVFAMGWDAHSLILGRALIGFGVSACLMASFKAFSVFYPPEKLPMVNGFIMAAGGLGALAGTAPTEALVQIIDWRGVFWGLAGLSLFCALLVFSLVPPTRRPAHKMTFTEQGRDVLSIFTNGFFWKVAPVTMMSQASFIAIQSLWVGPWHRDIAGLARTDVATSLFWIAAAMVAGFLGLGMLSSRLHRFGIKTQQVAMVGMGCFILAQALIVFDIARHIPLIWIAFGFFGTTGILNYAVLSQYFDKALAGRVNTAINLLVFVTIFILQSLSGYIINLWPVLPGGAYDPHAYAYAFGLLMALQVVAYAWFMFSPSQKA